MSRNLFLQSGKHLGALGEKSHVIPNWWVRLYDIGEALWVGAEYPDKARQIQPISWQPRHTADLLAKNLTIRLASVSQRPRLRTTLPPEPSPERPVLKRLAEPEAVRSRPALKSQLKQKLKPRS